MKIFGEIMKDMDERQGTGKCFNKPVKYYKLTDNWIYSKCKTDRIRIKI